MFRRKKKASNLEDVFNCADRGEVSAYSKGDGSGVWIECCQRCHAAVHVLIRESGARELACPRCLVICKPKDSPNETKIRVGKHTPNRIKRYLGRDDG